MQQCDNCKELDKRVLKWLDHVGCSPSKFHRYEQLLEFVKMIAQESNTIKPASPVLAWINHSAINLLEELEENEFLRSNGFAKSRKESNPE